MSQPKAVELMAVAAVIAAAPMLPAFDGIAFVGAPPALASSNAHKVATLVEARRSIPAAAAHHNLPAGQFAAALVGSATLAVAARSRHQKTQRNFFGASTAPAPAKPAFVLSEQVGCMEPLGYFDPLGFCPDEEAEFKKLRANEVKHGRLAMMASVGLLGQSFLGAGHGSISSLQTVEGPLGITFILMVSAFVEATWPEDPEKPGDFGDPLGFGQDSVEMRNKELNNGRMAMMSVVGIFVAEAVTGKDAVQQFGLF